MQTIRIKILNPVWSIAQDSFSREFVEPILTYEREYWEELEYGKKRTPYTQTLLTRSGKFLSGLIPRISETYKELPCLDKDRFSLKIEEPYYDLFETHISKPHLKGITLREDQIKLLNDILLSRRGVIKAPARSGKTVIAGALISMFKVKTLFACPTIDILQQTKEEFTKFGFDVGMIGKGKKEYDNQIIVSTYQSINRFSEQYLSTFKILIVDECHHLSDNGNTLVKALRWCFAPVRIGFTATIHKDKGSLMTMEGMLGPVIGEITSGEAIKIGIIAKPKLKLLKAPRNPDIKKLTYTDSYKIGITRSRARNRLITKTAKDCIDRGQTVLILVTRVEHGFNLKDMFNLLYPDIDVPFICGGVDIETQKQIKRLRKQSEKLYHAGMSSTQTYKDTIEDLKFLEEIKKRVDKLSKSRNEYRKALNAGLFQCIIATNIWNEGVNIPNLNVLINAAGGKSEISTIQMASRSLTATTEKKYGLIIDIFDDSNNYFISHFGERICLYMEEGWI